MFNSMLSKIQLTLWFSGCTKEPPDSSKFIPPFFAVTAFIIVIRYKETPLGIVEGGRPESPYRRQLFFGHPDHIVTFGIDRLPIGSPNTRILRLVERQTGPTTDTTTFGSSVILPFGWKTLVRYGSVAKWIAFSYLIFLL